MITWKHSLLSRPREFTLGRWQKILKSAKGQVTSTVVPSSWTRELCGCNRLGKRPRARQAGLHPLSLKAGRPRWEHGGGSGGRGLRPFLCPGTSSCDRRPGPLQKAGKPSWGFTALEENRDAGPRWGWVQAYSGPGGMRGDTKGSRKKAEPGGCSEGLGKGGAARRWARLGREGVWGISCGVLPRRGVGELHRTCEDTVPSSLRTAHSCTPCVSREPPNP